MKGGGKPFWQTAVPRWFFPVFFFWFTRFAEFQLNKRNSAVRHKNLRRRNEFICLENNIFNTRVSGEFLRIRQASFKRHRRRRRQSYGYTQVTGFTGLNTGTEKSIPTSGGRVRRAVYQASLVYTRTSCDIYKYFLFCTPIERVCSFVHTLVGFAFA